MELNELKLTQDVPTRWNSSYYMIQRLHKVRLPNMGALDDSSQKAYCHLLLKDRQWGLINELIEVLQPREIATSVLGGQQNTTASLILPVVANTEKSLHSPGTFSTTVSLCRASLARELRVKFRIAKQEASSPLVHATAMDPRFRALSFLLFVSFDKAALKQSVLATTMALSADPDLEQTTKEPTAKRPKKKESEERLNLIFGPSAANEECLLKVVAEEVQMYFSERPVPL